MLTASFERPWRIDTDVNGAGLAEYRWGAGAGCEVLCYLTIGTGVGGGLVIDGRTVRGAMHPEIGHLQLRRAAGDTFQGTCPFHGDCIEGLVSGPALAHRFRRDPALVEDADPAWQNVASDLAELAGSLLLTVSPQRIFVGGGVATARPALLQQIRRIVIERFGDYLPFVTHENLAAILREPALGPEAGPLGSIALALDALQPVRRRVDRTG